MKVLLKEKVCSHLLIWKKKIEKLGTQLWHSTSILEKPKKTKIKNGKTPKSSLTFSYQPNTNFSTDNEPLLHNPILHLLHLPLETLTPSSQFENPKSCERPNSYFLKYSRNPKNLVKLNRNLFFWELDDVDRMAWETIVTLFFFV